MPDVSILDQLRAVEREIGMRRRVYPHRVADGKMTQARATSEIAAMEAVADTLRGLLPPPPAPAVVQADLFPSRHNDRG